MCRNQNMREATYRWVKKVLFIIGVGKVSLIVKTLPHTMNK